jgi:uncharacterized protein (TIGR00730 family)
MSDIQSLCVYCGSSANVDDDFKQAAHDMGVMMAKAGIRLVYGGGKAGLMGIIADSVMDNGGEVIGIIPTHISDREIQHEGLTELHIVNSMHERKQMMVDYSDAFLVMPGGIGTLDETCEIMTWRQLGIHDKPIVIANLKNYWTPFLTMIDNIVDRGFMRADDKKIMIVTDTIDDVVERLYSAPKESFDPSSKWI